MPAAAPAGRAARHCAWTPACSTTSRRRYAGRCARPTATCWSSCPASAEINGVAGRLADLDGPLDVLALHGRLPAATQDAALRPGPRRRVVLASAVAESSLTVPGVRTVVDAGLSRVPRTDHARGLGALVTVRVSRASARATRRAGRPGGARTGLPVLVAAEHDRLPAQPEPEIAVADLTGFALQLACWGHPDGAGLALLDAPPAAAMTVAVTTLRALGAIDDAGRATDRGRAMAAVGAHPRLARALLDGAGWSAPTARRRSWRCCPTRRPPVRHDDLVAVWRRLRDRVDPAASARWREEVRRLRGVRPRAAAGRPGQPDDLAAGLVVGLAYPERLARARQPGAASYLMAGGTAAELAAGSALAGTRLAGDRGGRPRAGPAPTPGSGWPRPSTRRPPGRSARRC